MAPATPGSESEKPASESEKDTDSGGKDKTTEDEKKLLKKFYFNRSTDAGSAVQLEKQLKAEGVEYTYLEPDNTQQIIYCIALIGLPLAILL